MEVEPRELFTEETPHLEVARTVGVLARELSKPVSRCPVALRSLGSCVVCDFSGLDRSCRLEAMGAECASLGACPVEVATCVPWRGERPWIAAGCGLR